MIDFDCRQPILGYTSRGRKKKREKKKRKKKRENLEIWCCLPIPICRLRAYRRGFKEDFFSPRGLLVENTFLLSMRGEETSPCVARRNEE
ncbi:hypothetical protein BHM03_00055383, partial [Ensete ventricosum]